MPFLFAAIKDEDSDVRSAAADSLGKYAGLDERILPALIEMLGDREVAESASHIIGRLKSHGSDAIPHLTRLLDADDTALRLSCASALIGIDPTSSAAVSALRDLLSLDASHYREELSRIHGADVADCDTLVLSNARTFSAARRLLARSLAREAPRRRGDSSARAAEA